jgi:uncharacterized protein (DUF433 family)
MVSLRSVPPAQAPDATVLTVDEQHALREALRTPRGRYDAARAAQLSGVPERTVYYWANHGVLVPDHGHFRPKAWSYRDLVFLRLTAWLRSHQLPLDDVVARVADYRAHFEEASADAVTEVHTDGIGVSLGPLQMDPVSGQVAFDQLVSYTVKFDLLEPVGDIEHLGHKRLWGPNLVRPSARTVISPWVLAGEPCLRHTRIPTAALYAMSNDRGLSADDLADLYPEADRDAISDGLALENRLRIAA